MAINLWPQNATASLYKIKSCEGSGLQNGGLFILLVSLTADSTTTCFNKYKDYFDIFIVIPGLTRNLQAPVIRRLAFPSSADLIGGS